MAVVGGSIGQAPGRGAAAVGRDEGPLEGPFPVSDSISLSVGKEK